MGGKNKSKIRTNDRSDKAVAVEEAQAVRTVARQRIAVGLTISFLFLAAAWAVDWAMGDVFKGDVPKPDTSEPAIHAISGLRLDLNTSDAGHIALLPGIGPVLAETIVADRAANGPFMEVDALVRVHGIGPKTLARVRPYVRTGPTAPEVGLPASLDPLSSEAWIKPD